MNFPKKIFLLLLSVFIIGFFISCGSEEDPIGSGGSSAKEIVSFTLLAPVVSGVVDGTAGTVVVSLPNGSDVSALTPLIQVSEKASVSPASGQVQNFSSPVTYTVTAEDGSTKQFIVSVEVAATDSKKLLSFTFSGALGAGVDENLKTAWVAMPYNTSLTALNPIFSISGSVLYYGSNNTMHQITLSSVLNFENPMNLIVEAADASTNTYVVTVTNAPARTDCQIVSFLIDGKTAAVNHVAGTVALTVPYGSSRTGLSTAIVVSGGATVSPASGASQDFTSPVT